MLFVANIKLMAQDHYNMVEIQQAHCFTFSGYASDCNFDTTSCKSSDLAIAIASSSLCISVPIQTSKRKVASPSRVDPNNAASAVVILDFPSISGFLVNTTA